MMTRKEAIEKAGRIASILLETFYKEMKDETQGRMMANTLKKEEFTLIALHSASCLITNVLTWHEDVMREAYGVGFKTHAGCKFMFKVIKNNLVSHNNKKQYN